MAHPNLFNVYKGPDSMQKYFDPDFQPPLPLVELPSKLNPFKIDNVRIYAKMLTLLPAQNVKALPALNMLSNDPLAANKSIIEASSGSTATSLGMIARVLYNNNDTRVYVTNKTELNRIRLLQFFGLKVEVYGGPAQPEITDKRGIIMKAIRLAKENENICNPGQYESEFNWKAHIRWTGPQLWKQLPEINIFCMGMGSAGCVTGTGIYLKSHKPSVKVVGVCNAVGDPVPGPRAFPLFESCNFPWRETVDSVESVTSVDSYRLSMMLSREGLVCGPSSGMALKGLFQFLQKTKDARKLSEFADPDSGEISCVFVCCDLPQQYLDGYFDRLGEQDFFPITNESLLSFDLDKYVLDWELTPANGLKMLYGEDWSKYGNSICNNASCCKHNPVNLFSSSDATLLDLRSPQDFEKKHLSYSKNLPLPALSEGNSYLFDDIKRLHIQWKNMKTMFGGETLPDLLNPIDGPKIVICYDGETSRLATAVMRARGMEAFSIRGGMQAVVQEYLG